MMDQLVYKFLIERMLEKGLLSPQLHNLYIFYAGQASIFDLCTIVLWERLWDLLSVLSQPIAFRVLLFQLKLLLNDLVGFLFLR